MDVYIVQLQDSIPLGTVENTDPDASGARCLLLSGRNFTKVEEVVVNGLSIRDGWTLLSDTQLKVPLPSILSTAVIMEVDAYSNSVHDMGASRLVKRFGGGSPVRGVQYVVQLLVRWLFTTPGSDAWYPQGGGGWRNAVGYVDLDGKGTATVSELVDGLNRTVAFIQSLQARDPNTPAEELLASAEVIRTASSQRSVSIGIKVTTVAEDKHLVDVRAA